MCLFCKWYDDATDEKLSRHGLTASRFFHYGRPSSIVSKSGPDFAGLAAWLRGLEKPCALVAANDPTADDVIRLCETEGLVVPRDIAVLGMDDNPVFCRHTEPNLSSLRLDGRRAGFLAARALAALMDGAPAPDPASLRFGVSVSRRASTVATPSIGEIVQRAIDYIDANAVVATSVAGAFGNEIPGVYAVDGSHTFTAPPSATVGSTTYACTGYTLETWENGAWSSPKAAPTRPAR